MTLESSVTVIDAKASALMAKIAIGDAPYSFFADFQGIVVIGAVAYLFNLLMGYVEHVVVP